MTKNDEVKALYITWAAGIVAAILIGLLAWFGRNVEARVTKLEDCKGVTEVKVATLDNDIRWIKGSQQRVEEALSVLTVAVQNLSKRDRTQ